MVRVSDLRLVQVPVVRWPPPALEAEAPEEKPVAEFYPGRISAVLSLARTNQFSVSKAVQSIETIVHNYEGTKHE